MHWIMYKAKVIDSFSAAHRLVGYKGNCERLHGHNYRVEIIVGSQTLDKMGIVMDFRRLKSLLKKTLDEMDHRFLNDLDAFSEQNPSAENIARHIYHTIAEQIDAPVRLEEVIVWENETSCVSYS
ncbi:MAG: 6-carboxytetrahydropterin synthase QueD [Thermodesulfobacteriota bacterium]|nr:6-carboxytetrahydropterin synthase QueD [Thermodesulfobacteriota bacterium]